MKIRHTFTFLSLTFALGAGLAVFPATSLAAPEAKKPEAKAPENKRGKTAPKPYPLDVCIVTDNDLGSMGEETSMTYEGQVIKFCCAPCEKKFLKNPPKYLEKLAQEKDS